MSYQPPTRPLWRRWLDFWFAPADPTPLGFIRIVTGCLAVYVHLAYSFDLQNFFGKDGWFGLEFINRERREVPHAAPPLTWEEMPRGARVPDFPHRRAAVMTYLRTTAAARPTPAELEPVTRYVDKLQTTRSNQLVQDGLLYVARLSPDPRERANQLEVLKDEAKRKAMEQSQLPNLNVPPSPQAAQGLSPAERAAMAADADAFYRSLPTGDDGHDREYVLNHLSEMDWGSRQAFFDFLRRLTTLPAADREWELDYLDYWNTELRIAQRLGNPVFSLWFHVTDPTGMAVAHTVVIGIMVLFTVGLWTRVTSVLTWLAAVSYIHRTQQVMFGMDTMMNILLFYLMIGDSGAALSVDRVIKRYRAVRLSLQRSGTVDEATLAYLHQPPYSASAGFALRLLQVHFCFIYMAAGLSKLKGAAWWNHHAYWDTLVNPEFTLVHYTWYENLARTAVSSRPVYALMAAGGIFVTFFAEIGLPFLVWTRVRPWIVMFGFVLHAGVAVFMGLWIFSLLMMTLLLSYLPGAAIRDRLFGDPAATGRLTVRLSARTPRQVRAAALARALDFDDRMTVTEGGRGDGLRVEADGQEVPAGELFTRVGWLRPLRWVLLVPGLGGVVRRAVTGVTPKLPTPR
ncbi:MAG: hypothetical protein U0871_14795 [Gemmataceae bacterium]